MAVHPATPSRTYEGVILGVTERHVVQEHGDEIALHFKRSLLQTPILEAGNSVAVRYPHGGVGLVKGQSGERPVPLLDHDLERTRDKDLER
ncbi:KfrB domain-containing protein [Achromobacter pulmonis]|uniref:KfrB domain-containing protein n=1 Tax=Achromobacter pulmonis TaxID=1389932 RepID=UPI003B0093AB